MKNINLFDLFEITSALELELKEFRVTGEVDVVFWGGDEGTLDMKPFGIPVDEVSDDYILSHLNDNGFGVERIVGASVNIYAVYGLANTLGGYNMHVGEREYDEKQIAGRGKRGI